MLISLPRSQRNRLKAELRRAGAREIGGVLMGEQLGPNRFRIVDFSVDSSTGSIAHFVRTPELHQEALRSFFERTGSDYRRFNYLGEWHSHPSFSVRPSSEDIASMSDLVHGERNIGFAVLLIVRLRWLLQLDYSATLFASGRSPEQVKVLG